MGSFGPDKARCHVFTFKEGLLSPVAHDLKIAVARFDVAVDSEAGTVRATFDARSLSVVAAMKDGREDRSALSEKDKAKIAKNIAGDVLSTSRHPEIRFEGAVVGDAGADRFEVRGKLTLAGRTREVTAPVVREGGRLVARARLHQPDFGIKPYSAMLGTLKVQADVEVEVSVPDAATREE